MACHEASRLISGETLGTFVNAPCLYKYFSGDDKKPLLVLIPGGAHNARIFYGSHLEHDPDDFLATWLVGEKFGVLAISYPLESNPELMPAVSPGFRINDWGRQVAEVTKTVVDQNQLCGEIVLVGWSMGGRGLVPLSKAARNLGLRVKLFISLAATPGLHRITPPVSDWSTTASGYAFFSTMPKRFMDQIRDQEQRLNEERTIIPEATYLQEYYGQTPATLLSWHFNFDGQGGIADDEFDLIRDAEAHDAGSLPWIATIMPSSQMDLRHSLTDEAVWGFMLTQRLTLILESVLRRSPASPARWAEIMDFVHGAPKALSARSPGNHFFFLGRLGAELTAKSIVQHIKTADILQSRLERLMEDDV